MLLSTGAFQGRAAAVAPNRAPLSTPAPRGVCAAKVLSTAAPHSGPGAARRRPPGVWSPPKAVDDDSTDCGSAADGDVGFSDADEPQQSRTENLCHTREALSSDIRPDIPMKVRPPAASKQACGLLLDPTRPAKKKPLYRSWAEAPRWERDTPLKKRLTSFVLRDPVPVLT